MRAREFLSESRISLIEVMMTNTEWAKTDTKNKKKLKYIENLIDGLSIGQVFSFEYGGKRFPGIIQNPEIVAKQVISAARGKDEWKRARISFSVEMLDSETEEPTGQIIDNVPITAMFKDHRIMGELKVNMGDVSEIILGCAVATKFEKQGQPITEQDLINTAIRLAQNNGQITTSAGKDQLYFRVTVPFAARKAFFAYVGQDSRNKSLVDYNVNEDTVALIGKRIRSAVSYANSSKRVMTAINEAKNDPAKNKVDVISDGAEKENQTTTKVDLKILIDGREVGKRLLSIKAGAVGQFGQVGGHNFDKAQEFFSSTLGIQLSPTVEKKFIDVPQGRGYEDDKIRNFEKGFDSAYTDVFKQVKNIIKTNPDDFLESVFKGLKYHLTLNEPGVEMVILEPNAKKAFSELSFGDAFEQAVRQLEFSADYRPTSKGYYLTIYARAKTPMAKKFVPRSKDTLITLLTSMTPTYNVRNRINMGSLLKHIADIENQIEQAQATPQQVQQQPAPVQQQQPAPVQQNPTGGTPGIRNQTKQPGSKELVGALPVNAASVGPRI
jgi:hypothetical protein